MGDIQMDQSSYVKNFTEELHMREYMCSHKEDVSGTKHFKTLGPISWNKVMSCFVSSLFIMFLKTWNSHNMMI